MADTEQPELPFARQNNASPFLELMLLLHLYIDIFGVVFVELKPDLLTLLAITGPCPSLGFVQ
jgi:hypothetical protein